MAARFTALIVVTIVAATLIAGLVVGAMREEVEPADLIVTNGRVFTADGSGVVAQAVAARGAQIIKVGSTRDIRRLRRDGTVEIDARGGTVMPGFNDAHLHFMSGGLSLSKVELLDATTLDRIGEKIRAFAAANPDAAWVQGRGWYYEPFPGGLPHKALLDELVPDRPAYMVAYDGHTAWVNSRALRLAGVTRRTKDPRNGVVVRDARTGEPTGVLKETAMSLVARLLPEPTRDERLGALRTAMREAHRLGVTSVQNAHGSADEFALYDALRRSGELKVRVYSALSVGPGYDERSPGDDPEVLRQRYPDDPLFKTGAIKMLVDGVIEGHTAVMLEPYSNRPGERGTPRFAADELQRLVTSFDRRGWQIMIHAIGDGGIRMVLDAFERAAAENPVPARGRRHRIEHIETTDLADIPRFGKLGVIASMQPFHANPSPNQIGVWTANIGDARAARGWVYGSIRAGGGRLAFGSDWPVVTLDPRFGLNMAVNRTTPEGTPEGGWYPAERMPLALALEAYTSGAAWASFDEQRKGRLAPGQLADIVILSKDVFALPSSRLLEAEVTMTIFDGKVVYRREATGT
jgi:predicted amidohydrolase YtcJ